MNDGENLKMVPERRCCIKNWLQDKELAAKRWNKLEIYTRNIEASKDNKEKRRTGKKKRTGNINSYTQ